MSISALSNRATSSQIAPESGSATCTVAVIDDNSTWTDTVEELLRAEGFDVRSASDGHEAAEFLIRVRPKLVILDIDLPGVSGLQILSEFRRRDGMTPVLVVSADDRALVRDRAMSDGASGFLQKPVPASVLVRAVRRLTGVSAARERD